MTKYAGLSPENKLPEMRPAAATIKHAKTFKLNPFSPFAPKKPLYDGDEDKYDIGEDAWWNGMVLPARNDSPMILSGFAGLPRPGEGRPTGFYATLSRPSAKKGIGIDSYAMLRYAGQPSRRLERPSLRPDANFYVQRSPAPKKIGKPAPVPTLKAKGAKALTSAFFAPSGASARSNLMVIASYLYSGQKRPEL